MKKPRTGCIIVLLLVIAAGAVGATIWARDYAGEFKDRMLEEVSEKSGRQITAGEVGGNPFTGLSINDIRVAPVEEGYREWATVKAIKFRISFADLFRGKISFTGITIAGPEIYVERPLEKKDRKTEPPAEAKDAGKKAAAELRKYGVSVRRVNISRGKATVKLLPEDGQPIEITADGINGRIQTADPGTGYIFKINGNAGKVPFTADGEISADDFQQVSMRIKTSRPVQPGDLPVIGEKAVPAAERAGFDGRAEVSADMDLGGGTSISNAVITVTDMKLLGQGFGTLSLNGNFNDGLLEFSGGTDGIGAAAKISGKYRSGETPRLDSTIDLSGIDTASVIKVLWPELPELVSGVMNATVTLGGEGILPDAVVTNADVTVKGGTLRYPSPKLDGTGRGWAPIPFNRLDAQVRYHEPEIVVKSAKLDASPLTASGSGGMKFSEGKEPGEKTGPVTFHGNINIDCPRVQEILAHNPYLGEFVTGALSARGNLGGSSAGMQTLAGKAVVSLNKGTVTNPYIDNARNLPLNANLSHYEFDKISGDASVGNEVINVKELSLYSKLIDATLKGTVGFDGKIAGTADTALDPSVISTVEDLKVVVPKLARLEKIGKVETSFTLGGSISNPAIEWNANRLLERIAEKQVEKQAGKVVDKLKKKLGEETGLDVEDDMLEKLKDKAKDKLKSIF